MIGKHGCIVTQITQIAPEAKFTHCSIHCKVLATKSMPNSLRSVGNSHELHKSLGSTLMHVIDKV